MSLNVQRLTMPEVFNPFKISVHILLSLFFLLALNQPCFSETHKQQKLAADHVVDQQPIDTHSQKYEALFKQLHEQHNFSYQELEQLFAGVSIHRKILVLMDRQWEAKPYYQYRQNFITPAVVATGLMNFFLHQDTLERVEKEFGVDKEIVLAIWGIESRYGNYTGQYNVFTTLNTLFAAYPRRSAFFRKELIHFLILCRENNLDPHQIKGSYAGAFGETQFISSSFRRYAVDFDNNGTKDVFDSTEDILASIANYLHCFGWQLHGPLYFDIGSSLGSPVLLEAYEKGRKGRVKWDDIKLAQQLTLPKPVDNSQLSIVGLERSSEHGGGMRYLAGYPNFQTITQWNHSNRYAMAVSQLAEYFRK